MRSISLGIFALTAGTACAQLAVNSTLTPTQLVEDVLLGSGITVSNISFNGVLDPGTPQPGSGSFTYTGTGLELPAGVILSSGSAGSEPGTFGADGTVTDFASSANGTGSDPDLFILADNTINDRAVLEFDFVPVGDTVKFNYVFSSEEYPEYACTQFFDVFGFFLSGPGISGPFSNNAVNIALIPGGTIPVGVNTINPGVPGSSGGNAATCAAADPNWQSNAVYYTAGQAGTGITYDGLTVTLEARYVVQCGETYHIKMAISDAGDSSFDSAVFLEAGSFTSSPFVPTLTPGPGIIGLNTILESCYPVTIDFTQTGAADDTSVVYILVGGTATAGIDYTPAFPDSLIFLPGDSTQSLTFTCPVDWDGQETIVLTLISQSDCADVTITNEFIFYIENSPPLIIVGGFDEIPCGGSTTLTPTVQGGFAPYTISWTGGSVGPTLTVSPLQNTVYTATVTDDCGTTSIAQFFVELTPLPPLVMQIIGSGTLMEACDQAEVNVIRPQGIPGDLAISFTFSGNAENGPDFVFPPSTTILDGTNNITLPFGPFEDGVGDDGETVTITGSYSDACGATATASVTFTITDAPFLGVETDDFIIECQPDSLLLVAEGIGGVGSLSYLWSNGDQGPSTYVTMQVPGNYTVTATDQCGRTASDVAIITVVCDVIIPNVITPNGDGSNDIFEIVGIEYVSNTVRVFNRWGQEVYAASNYRNQWNGGDLPDGTYYYEVTVSRKDEPYTGHLTILRNGW